MAYAREGALLVLVGRRTEKLECVAQECGTDPLIIPTDVSSPSAVHSLMAETVSRYRALHVLLNNAGILHAGTAEQVTPEQWDETFNINVRGVWLLSRAALPHMRAAGGGSIINIASVLGINGARLRAAYSASKGADHGHERIRVNAICPSFIETDLTAAYIRNTQDPEAVRRERISVHPLGRLGEPEDMAGIAVYLASDESSWATGAVYPVDGGYLAV